MAEPRDPEDKAQSGAGDTLPLPSWPMGPPLVDITDREAIDELMDQEIPWLREMREATAKRRAQEEQDGPASCR